jgi:excisionase family DNA binding protein
MASETLTVQEVADYLRVSRQTVYTMVRTGKLPHFRVGNKVRFKRSEIDALTKTALADPQQGGAIGEEDFE